MNQTRGWVKVSVRLYLLILMATAMLGCSTSIPKSALKMTAPTLEQRQMQTRRYSTHDEKKILSATAGLLQDLGFTIEESETQLGFVLGAKSRDATDGGQVAGAVIISALFGTHTTYDKNQKMRACIVTHPSSRDIAVRVTFQRVVWNNDGIVSRVETLNDPEQYQVFFDRLSKAVFLEAHEL